MKIEVVMPKMGESLQEGTIIRWMKKEGEKVERDEMILEISTDKVDTEVPSPAEGVISKILYNENETVEVGVVIAIIETEGQISNANEQPIINQELPTQKDIAIEPIAAAISNNFVDVVMPKMGESLQEGTIIRWMKKEGEKVERDEMILEISTDKVDTEVPSPVSGVLSKIIVPEGTTVEVGAVIAKIASSSSSVTSQSATQPAESISQVKNIQTVETDKPIESSTNIVGKTYDIPSRYQENFFSPLVREIAVQNKVSLEELITIKGTGADGRVSKLDILNYIDTRGLKPILEQPIKAEPKQAAVVPAPVSAPTAKQTTLVAPFGPDTEVIPMDRVRSLISEHMIYSKQTSAHVTSVGEADVSGIVRFRNKFKNEFEKRERMKLTFTPFFAQAAVGALKAFPMVNVSIDGKNILRHRKINLSFATALDDGNLIVPVIKNADNLNLAGLQKSITDLASRARNKKLNPDEIQGGTFTITNVGTFGTLFGTPIINQPQCGIMGIGAIKKRPVVKEVDGEFLVVIRDMAYISITYDHRVIDGMLAGQWLAEAIKLLENMNEDTISL